MTNEAIGQFIAPIEGMGAIRVAVRAPGQNWQLAASRGELAPEHVVRASETFDAEDGGSVAPLADRPGEWLAQYSCAAPGLDLCLIVVLHGADPAGLHPRLSELEERTGWVLIAALRDAAAQLGAADVDPQIVSSLLLKASEVSSADMLRQQWVSALEKAFRPNAVMIVDCPPGGARLVAMSGGGLIGPKSAERDAAEALAGLVEDRRQPFDVTTGHPETETDETFHEAASGLIAALGSCRVVAVPVFAEDRLQAVALLLWSDDPGPVIGEAAVDTVSRALADSLAIHGTTNPAPVRRLRNWALRHVMATFGRRAWKLKLALAVLVLSIAVMALIPSQARPGFSGAVEAQDRRMIAAPFDGYVAAAPFRVGDTAGKGDLLLAMDTSELRLQRSAAEAEITRLTVDGRAALAKGDMASVRSLDSQRQQYQLHLDLLNSQIEQATVQAAQPLQILGGDAFMRVGGRVRLGETLIEVGRPESLGIAAYIDEDWVSELHPGMTAEVSLAAFPDRPLKLVLRTVTSDAQMQSGVNVFRARLDFDAPPGAGLLEGMRGVVRIDAGPSTLLADYTRGIRRWFGAVLWRWS